MKLLVDMPLLQYGKAATYCGIQSFAHNTQSMSTFDTFDRINPDIYLANLESVSEAVLKNLEERPGLKVAFFSDNKDHPNKQKVISRFGSIYSFYEKFFMADLIEYSNAQKVKEYQCEIISIDQNLPEWILSLDFPKCVKFRIFNMGVVKSNNYCGYATPSIRKNLYASSLISISSGDEYCNSAICGCYPIAPSTYEEILEALETDRKEELEKIKEGIYNTNNNFYAISQVLRDFGYSKEANNIIEKSKELR